MRILTLPRDSVAHGRLLEEMIIAVPALVTVNADGDRLARYSMRVTDTTVEISYPEDVPEKTLQDVIAAHDKHAPARVPAPVLALRAIAAARTLDDLKTAVLAYLKADRGLEP